jgi:photosystem II stability/assembly factor-like uncharacterized protein
VAQRSGVAVRLRGVSAVSSRVAWASGDKGTYARTTDGGKTWRAGKVAGAEELDFRDVDAFDADTAYLLSIGAGALSRIYKTTDGGAHWSLQFTNPNPEAFFDAMAFWDAAHGIALSDPVKGRFHLVQTSDGGKTWRALRADGMPPALEGEAAFAASGTCITVGGRERVWFGTGGGARARIFHSSNRGRTWEVFDTPIIAGGASAGIFSVAFRSARHGVIVGGDYKQETETRLNAARTGDGGRTWQLVENSRPRGFRSGVAYVSHLRRALLVAVGPSGADYSDDDGRTWHNASGTEGFHSLSFARVSGAGWAVGEQGRTARYAGASRRRN